VTQIKTAFPKNVLTAGYFTTTNNGKKVIVNTAGNPAGTPGTLAVRCNVSGQTYPNSCLNYDPTRGQVSPDTKQDGYSGGNALSSSDRSVNAQRKKWTAVPMPMILKPRACECKQNSSAAGHTSASSNGCFPDAQTPSRSIEAHLADWSMVMVV